VHLAYRGVNVAKGLQSTQKALIQPSPVTAIIKKETTPKPWPCCYLCASMKTAAIARIGSAAMAPALC
jgi:hypothetical protein